MMLNDSSISHLLAIGSEDVIPASLAATAILYYLVRKHTGPSKHELSRLEELFSVPQRKSPHASALAQLSAPSRNVCDLVQNLDAVVFWASQGGAAETLASRCALELSATFHLRVATADLADYDYDNLPDISSRVIFIFVVSTFGEGDPPDNGVSFLEGLQELQKESRNLNNIRYLMLGLGNSNYTHFNRYAIRVDSCLATMNATRLGVLGLADDRHGATEEDFMVWKEETKSQVGNELGLEPIKTGYIPRIRIVPSTNHADGSVHGMLPSVYQGEPPDTSSSVEFSNTLILPIQRVEQLIPFNDTGDKIRSSRECVHMEFSLESYPSVTYETGDYLSIRPINPDHEVNALLHALGVWGMRGKIIDITPVDEASPSTIRIPTPATLESLFRYYFDICGPVSRELVADLADFTTNQAAKSRLEELASHREIFHEKVAMERLTLAAVLQKVAKTANGRSDTQSPLKIPISYILERLKKLQPRSYSISSSNTVEPRVVAVTALAVRSEEASNGGYEFRGVASNYLLQLQQEFGRETSTSQLHRSNYLTKGPRGLLNGGKIFARIRRSNFKPPSDPSVPILMIGTGTGVAPFRAFVQERMKLKLQGASIGKTTLLVGHRAPHEDFYYSEVWNQAQECLGEAFELCTAFSRVDGQPRQYVQDVLATKSDLLLTLLAADRARGVVYICGSLQMASGVKKCLAELWTQSSSHLTSLPGDDAQSWISELSRQRRLQEDSWG